MAKFCTITYIAVSRLHAKNASYELWAKGPAGVRGISRWTCTKCSRVLSRRDALRDHSLKKHGWCIDTNAPVTEEAIRTMRENAQLMIDLIPLMH